MDKQQLSRHVSRGLIAGISVAALALGGGAAWWGVKSIFRAKQVKQQQVIVTEPENKQRENLLVYWVQTTETGIEIVAAPITVRVEDKNRPQEMLLSAFKRLLAGNPRENGYVSAIPEGTKLLGLSVKDKEVIVDLSQEFTEGGGSAAMISRLGQVIYTASSLDPQTNVHILVEGEPLEVLGGEGVIVEQPTNRKIFKEDFELAKNNYNN